MNKNGLLARTRKERAISPIIATLLLILIAIAAGTIVYAYVIGFIGSSTGNSGGTQSVVSVDNFCISATTNCNANGYSISIWNVDSPTISSGATIELYFTDSTSQSTGQTTCTSTLAAPGATISCPGAFVSTGLTAGAGHTISLKVVMPDGGSTTSSTKELS